MVCPITAKRHAKKWNTEFTWRIYYMSIICHVHKWQYMTFRSLATFRHFEVCTQIKFFFISIIQLFLNIFYFWECFPSICLYVPCEYWSLQRLEASISSPGTAVTEDFDSCEWLEQNPDLLQEQKMLLTLKCPFFLLHNAVFNVFFFLLPRRNFTNIPCNEV